MATAATTSEESLNETSESGVVPGSSTTEDPQPIGEYPSIEKFTQSAFKELVSATKCMMTYPQGAKRDLFSTYPSFCKIVDQQSHWILNIISKVMKMNNIRANIERRPDDEQLELITECNDVIMERLNCHLDEMRGLKRSSLAIVPNFNCIEASTSLRNEGVNAGSWNLNSKPNAIKANFAATRNMERPQFKFQIPIDNSSKQPFIPKLKDKPNSLKPLAILPEYDEAGNIASYVHPYEFELMKFDVSESQLKERIPQEPKELEECDWLYVDSVEALDECLADLRNYNEIAIDLEHHSYRSFQGITCLVQLSTRDKDYIIDALKLRDDLHILNEIFTNPKIVKVLHGADSDIEWLQRDLALYIVNMFDTHQAAKTLNMARLSLSYLLKYYCNLDVDKTFQLADWRIRPLPEELITYARQDTHYLLYVYDRITNDLLKFNNGQDNLLRAIYQRSTEICRKRYEKPVVDEEAHLDVFRKSRRTFDNRQLTALKEIYQWRDSVARTEDESYGYVLPNHMLLQISESLPREMQGILACCNPVPPLVRQHLHTLHQIILKAREQPLVKPILETDTENRIVHNKTTDYHNVLFCPHDNSHVEEFRDDLPTLLNFTKSTELHVSPLEDIDELALTDPIITAFDAMMSAEKTLETRAKARLQKRTAIKPYLRYLTMLPEVERRNIAEAERQKRELEARQLCPASHLNIKIKQEIENETMEEKDEEDLYKMPIKEMLKRKRSVADDARDQKQDENEECNDPKAKRFKHTTPKDDKLKFVDLPAIEKELKELNKSTSIASTSKDTTQSTASKNKSEIVANGFDKPQSEVVTVTSGSDADDDDDVPVEVPISNEPVVVDAPAKDKLHKKSKKKFKAKQKLQHPQSSNKPIDFLHNKAKETHNFDYKNVDFKRFQGGAQRAKGPELKGQFHAKSNSNKAQNKKFNKLFTFSNVKNNKK